MSKRLFTSIVGAACLIFGLAIAASAQSAHRFEIDVPFPFILRGRTLPAGKYKVERLDAGRPNLLLLTNTANGNARSILLQRVEKESPSAKSCLIFIRREERFYLFQVWTMGDMNGTQVPQIVDDQRRLGPDNVASLVKVTAKSP